MIDIEKLGREALSRIKSKWGLPESGFLAGGSLANIVWELVSGNKAIVNDVDIFVYNGEMNLTEANEVIKSGKKLSYLDRDLVYSEDYSGMNLSTSPKEFYTIDTAYKDGIFNYIKYKSSTHSPSIIINSFDLNCTTIGYSIDEDKLYWLDSFQDFLETGELKVTNLTTPCHTIVRICKKQSELNAKLDEFEYMILSYALKHKFVDRNKDKFSSRYFKLYKQYELQSRYNISKLYNSEQFLKNKIGEEIDLYTLEAKFIKSIFGEDVMNKIMFDGNWGKLIFDDSNITSISSSRHFLFYMRNIFRNERLKKIWEKTRYFFTTEEYIDVSIVDDKKLDILSRLAQFAPNTINSLKDFRLSKQLDFVDNLFDKFKDDPLIGIAILEKYKLDEIDLNDDKSLLILELTVRKNIADDPRNKVEKILQKNGPFRELDNVSFWDF